MKIGLISHGLGTQGGIENVVQNLSAALARLGQEVTVFCMARPVQPPKGVQVELVPVPNLPWVLRQFWFAIASRRLKDWKGGLLQAHVNSFAPIDMAVCHSVHPVGTAKVLALDPSFLRRNWQRIKTVSPAINWLSGAIYRAPSLKLAVATSKGIGRELLGLYPGLAGRLATVPNGFDPAQRYPATPAQRLRQRRRLGLKPQDRVLLFVGKEFHRKGLEPALQALPLLPSTVKLWVIGRNVDVIPEAHFHRVVAELGLEGRVRFWGHQADLLPYYQAADAFIFPTLYEAFAMVSIESLACGLPLLATRANGTEDLVRDGRNGAFVLRDGGSIAAVVKRWILPEAKRRTLVKGALRSAQAYTWDRIAKRHLALCRRVLASKRLA